MTKVQIIKCEIGEGQRIDETLEFDTDEQAEQYCREYNSEHNPYDGTVPNWFIYARMEGQKQYGMLRLEDLEDKFGIFQLEKKEEKDLTNEN